MVMRANKGVHKSVLQTWIKQYEIRGVKAFEKGYTSYTLQYKLGVLNYMNEQGTSIREPAAIFNIPSPSTLFQWKQLLETQGVNAVKLKKKGRPSMTNEDRKSTKPAEGSVGALQEENGLGTIIQN
jgi:transposase